ncbi:MAG: leucine-rich repeat protein [Oscillospiraceae bacterium]|nr:leucine-rich repeat protein [Oscillospiraceae bacterium]
MNHSKLIAWLSAAVLGITAAAFPSDLAAEAATGTGTTASGFKYTYDTETGEATITGYTGSGSALMIPANANGYRVTAIDDFAFWNRHFFTSVYIPGSVREIGIYAFAYTNLTSVSIPASVTHVDQGAFADCASLTYAKVSGATELSYRAFGNCPVLSRVQLSANSWSTRGFNWQAFENCPALYTVNGVQALQHGTDSSGRQYPVLHPSVTTAIRNHFSRSVRVGFVDDYCTELCNYIVATETDPWMNDALKARQLHDWLVRHCEYEDRLNGESLNDNENHVASSVFLSYAINVRGEGIGETVCDGFAKAYTMLLTTAGIESYHVGNAGHAWNLVRIGDSYYHADVTWDNHTEGTIYGTMYTNFLKDCPNSNCQQNHPNDHALLTVYNNDVSGEILNCVDYPDSNGDGILDNDFDLDGTAGGSDYWEDLLACQQLRGQYGYDININDKLPEVLYRLHQQHHGFWG